MENGLEKTFLFCHPGSLGDVLLTAPALLALKKVLPPCRWTGIGCAGTMRLAAHLGWVDAVVDGESRECIGFFSGQTLPASAGQPAGAVLWLKNGEKTGELLEKTAPLGVACLDPSPCGAGHVAFQHCRKVQDRFHILLPVPLYRNFPAAEPGKGPVLIHPGSGSRNKNFSREFYLSAAGRLKALGFDQVLFLLGPAERSRGESGDFPAREVLCPPDAVRLASVVHTASLYIGNDSGPSHLAGYLGVPSIVLYRSTDPLRWGVVGKRVRHVAASDEVSAWTGLSSCLDKNGKLSLPPQTESPA
jgi:heptosyltransferase-3